MVWPDRYGNDQAQTAKNSDPLSDPLNAPVLTAGERIGRGGVHTLHGAAHAAARLSLVAQIPTALKGLRAITGRHAGGLRPWGCWSRENREVLAGAIQRTRDVTRPPDYISVR